MEKARISGLQLFLLMTGFLLGSRLIINPGTEAKADGWLAILISGTGGLLLITLYSLIVLLNPSRTLVEILRDRFGNAIGSVVAVFYIWYFIHLASLVFRDFGSFLVTTTYPRTPMEVIIALFALSIIYAANSGIEVMGRISEILVPFIPFLSTIIGASIVTTHDFTAFLPVLENGIKPVIKESLNLLTFPFGEAVVFLTIFPYLNNKRHLKKITTLSTLLVTVLFLYIFFRNIIILESHFLEQATFVPHLTSVLFPGINLEPLFDVITIIGGGIKITCAIYAAVISLSQLTGAKDYRIFTSCIVAFSVILSLWIHENIFELFSWTGNVWAYYSIPFQVVIPFILLLFSLFKKDKLQDEE
jgi:spore germination protein KB